MKFFKRKSKEAAPPPPESAPAAVEPAVSEMPPAPAAQGAPAAAPQAVPAAAQPIEAQAATGGDSGPGFFSRLRRGLGRTSDNLVQGLGTLFLGRKEIDIDLIEERRRSGSFFTTSRRTWFTSDAIVLACRA